MGTWVIAALISGSALVSLKAAPLYSINPIPGHNVIDISQSGYVTGTKNARPYLYRNGAQQELESLQNVTVGRGVNIHGDVTGYAWETSSSESVAFVYRNGQYDVIPTVGGYAITNAINDHGWVAGVFERTPGRGDDFGFLYRDGNVQQLDFLPSDINNAGQMTGSFCLLYDNNACVPFPHVFGSGSAVNERGSVTGSMDFENFRMGAFVYRNGTIIDLSTIGFNSAGADLNDLDHVVGSHTLTPGGEDFRGFLWRDGVVYDLTTLVDTPGFVFEYPIGINNSGQIVGYGRLSGSSETAFLLQPVPEAQTCVLMMAGLIALAAARWRAEQDRGLKH